MPPGSPMRSSATTPSATLEPDLPPIYEVALHVPGDGFCRDPYKLTTSLAEATIREGAEFLRAEVTGFERSNGAISAVKELLSPSSGHFADCSGDDRAKV
jgi:FAD dependent oxidoreductase